MVEEKKKSEYQIKQKRRHYLEVKQEIGEPFKAGEAEELKKLEAELEEYIKNAPARKATKERKRAESIEKKIEQKSKRIERLNKQATKIKETLAAVEKKIADVMAAV